MQEIKKIKCSLAIVITTYKRSEEILSRIAELQDVISNKIKLYIFDDDPKSMLAQKISELNIKNIKYQKNRKNLGQSLNLITNIKNVEEDYIFISADDDIIDSQKLKKYFYLSYEQRAQITILDFLHIKELHLNKHFDGSFKVMLDSFAIINEVLKIGKGGNIIFKKNVNVICSTEDYYVGSLFEDKGLILKNLLHFKTVKGLLINDYIGSEQHSYGNELRYSLRVFMNFNMLRSQIYAMEGYKNNSHRVYCPSLQALWLSLITIFRCFITSRDGVKVSKQVLLSELYYIATLQFLRNHKHQKTKN